jgi:hypothetical protein
MLFRFERDFKADSATLSFYATKDGRFRFTRQRTVGSPSLIRVGIKARLCSTGNSSCWGPQGGRGVAMADCMGAVKGNVIDEPTAPQNLELGQNRPNQNRGFIRQVAAGRG